MDLCRAWLQPMKKAFTLFALLTILLLAGCSQPALRQGQGDAAAGQNDGLGGDGLARQNGFEKVTFRTEDGFTIMANFSRGGSKGVVLMHQFTLDKGSYNNLARKLGDANFTVLAIDLRGHGESLDQNGLKRGYASFSERDFRDMVKDVKAAKRFLQQQGSGIYAVVGASIGANTAVNYAVQDSSVEKIVLLSPGLNFKGIETESAAGQLKAKTLIVASAPDDSYSYGSGKALKQAIPNSEFMELRNAGHGTKMFTGTFLENDIVKWLVQ